MKKHLWICLAVVTALPACQAPRIKSLNPNTGPERTLVQVNGDTFLSTLFWDAGSASQRSLPGGFLGSYCFSVPPGASLGAHDVQLRRWGLSGNTETFSVTAPVPFGAPRLDRISLGGADFQPAGQVNAWLLAQGANIDVGAEVLINGTVVPTVAFKGIQNNLFGVQPQDLAFPIYHYLALLAVPGPQAVSAALNVQVRNLDGQLSNTIQYQLPASAATMDSDGDDFPDLWEINGFDADGNGTIDVDFPALGASPFRPDIFVEVDVMTGLANTPGAAVWDAVRAGFSNAPVINLTAENGIHLVLDTTGTVPFSQLISMTAADDPANGLVNFLTLKGANFDNARRGRVYHYCVWANMMPNGSSGTSDPVQSGGDFTGPGDDFIVSFDDFSAANQTVRSMAATFMHELGHNLQQRHGGSTHATFNPTYSSVMSYAWQLRTGASAATRRSRPIYAPFYYQLNGAVEVNGAIPAGVTSVLPDYSQGMGQNLVENNLNEPAGLYNANALDWNNDGDTLDNPAVRDLNNDGDTTDTLIDFSNWANLIFSGPRLNGGNGN